MPERKSHSGNYSKRGATMTDGRRTRWVAHDVYFLDDPLGSELFDTFGAAGVALWFAVIAAAKKSVNEGEFRYGSDSAALDELGLPDMPMVTPTGDPFTLDDFFDVLSRYKVTRRKKVGGARRSTASRRAGRGAHVVFTRWEKWQRMAARQRKAEQQRVVRDVDDTRTAGGPDVDRTRTAPVTEMADSRNARGQTRRSEAQSIGTKPSGNAPDTSTDTDTDTDTDKTLGDAAATPKKSRPRDLIFEAVAEVCGIDWHRMPANERGRVNTAAKQLRDIDATPDEIRAKAAAYRKTWPDVSLTPMALVSNWSQVDAGTRGVSLARCESCDQPLGDSHDDDKCSFVAGLLAEGS